MRQRRHPEDDLCRAITHWLRVQKPDCVAFHVPNGGKRDRVTAAILKAMGVMPGVYDWVVLMPAGADRAPRCGFIECKAGQGRLSDSQRKFRDQVEAMGFATAVCRSLDDWKAILRDWGVTWKGQRRR